MKQVDLLGNVYDIEIETNNDFAKSLQIELLEKDKEIERLNKENNDLRKIYQRTYKHLFEIGNDELARYFQAQIDECPTFYVEPIIDYYEETKRLNNIINEFEEWLCEEQATYRDYLIREPKIASDYGERNLTLSNLTKVSDKLQELKGDSSNE